MSDDIFSQIDRMIDVAAKTPEETLEEIAALEKRFAGKPRKVEKWVDNGYSEFLDYLKTRPSVIQK